MSILTTQATLLSLLLLGALGRKCRLFPDTARKTIASLVYYFLMPGLFFAKMSQLDLSTLHFTHFLGALLPTAVIMLALLLLKLTGLFSRETYLLLNLSICFASNSFFGVPFFTNLYGEPGQAFAVITSTFMGIWGLFFLTLFFEYRNSAPTGSPGFMKLIKNPLLLSILAGALFSLLGIEVPLLTRTAELLGKATVAPAIMLLGIFFVDSLNRQTIKKALFFSLFRLVSLPLITVILVKLWFASTEPLAHYLVLQGGMPVAISVAVFAERYNWNQGVLANIVILSSALSFFALTGLYLCLGVLFP